MRKKIVGRTGIGIGIFLMFLLFGIQSLSLAENVPIFYEDFANTGSSPAFVAANSKGDFFELKIGYCSEFSYNPGYIVKLDNNFNEINRWNIPCNAGFYNRWFNEISVDPEDNVWISSYFYQGGKQFIKFDIEGNYLGSIIVPDRRLQGGGVGFTFDSTGNIYFISVIYTGYRQPAFNVLSKVNSKTGTLIKQWTVPVTLLPGGLDGGWHRGMGINSKGELFWGCNGAPEIYMFNPQTEESKLFALLPSPEWALQLSIDSKDNMYVMPEPSYHGTIQIFDKDGNHIGSKSLQYGNLCSRFEGCGITTFSDEIVVTGYRENLVVKYTSNKENSKEQLYKCYGPTDAIPPMTTLTPYGTIGVNNWYITDVQVTLTAVDNEGGSGVKKTEYSFDGATWNTYSAPFTITKECVMTIYYKSTDNAGNVETTKSTSIKIDKTSPTTSVIISGTSGNNGWYKSDVNINLISTDNCSGVKEIHYILDGAETIIAGSTAGFTISADGTHTLSFWAVDNANNTETAHPATINIDKTPPAITATASPAENANGWNNTDVTVSFTCADATSGIISCTSPVTVITEGAGQEICGTAIDNAGNSANTCVTLNIDKTPPDLNVTVTSGLLWPPNHKMVNITPLINVSDNLTSVKVELVSVVSNEPDNGLGDGDTPNDIVINTDGTILLRAERSGMGTGRVYTITYKATDLAGNVTVASATAIVLHDMRN